MTKCFGFAHVVENLNVAELIEALPREVDLAEFLALVHVGGAAVRVEHARERLRASFAPRGIVIAPAGHGAGLIVILKVQGVPSAFGGDFTIPAGEVAGELVEGKRADGVELVALVFEADVLELEHHFEFAAFGVGGQERVVRGNTGGFADVDEGLRVFREDFAAHFLHEFVEARTGHDHRESGAETVLRGWTVRKALGLRDEVDDVHAETVDAAVEPPAHHVVNGLADLGVFPIEVGLLAREHVEVELLRFLVPLPAWAAEGGIPVVRFSSAFAGCEAFDFARVAPDVPVALGVFA